MSRASLPPVFALDVKDDAMAPLMTTGNKAMFARDKAPIAGRPVLFKDSSGGAYIRDYIPKPGGGWTAKAKNPAYESIDSDSGELEILATMTGYTWAD